MDWSTPLAIGMDEGCTPLQTLSGAARLLFLRGVPSVNRVSCLLLQTTFLISFPFSRVLV